GDFAHFLRDANGKWEQLTRFEDGVKHARFGRDRALYLLTLKDAPRGKLLRLPLGGMVEQPASSGAAPPLATATVVAPEGKGVIQEFVATDNGMYVSSLEGGPSEFAYYPRGSTHAREVTILPVSTVGGLQAWQGNEVLFGNASYLNPF